MLLAILLESSSLNYYVKYLFYLLGYLATIPTLLYFGKRLLNYILTWKIFYNHSVVDSGKINTSSIYKIKIINLIASSVNSIKQSVKWVKTSQLILAPILIPMLIIAWMQALVDFSSGSWIEYMLYVIYPIVGSFFWSILLASLLRTILESLHPLYAFWNLWSKIQSLTPRISDESKKIEKEFSTDMNFRTLSDAFDTLAKDFNTIIEYVIRLEIIEKKANKWNLFDSTKYINSLREDIRNPLIALRSFLEKKKTELESSQEEMKKVKVRVWWNGETENLDLSSKRTEPLIQELTENIEKLDRMIEKF